MRRSSSFSGCRACRSVVRRHPERIRAIYIRSIDLNARRIKSIEKLIKALAPTRKPIFRGRS
jgi:phosphatidate phosphatase APP1